MFLASTVDFTKWRIKWVSHPRCKVANNVGVPSEMIWQVVAAVPAGRVASYGQVARLAGFPRHARFVGTTLKKLPGGSALPWHRIVNAKGEIAFPAGSAKWREQRDLLEAEGVEFIGDKIPLKRFQWTP